MKGYSDGSLKGTRLFQCQPGRGFFCPLTAVRPDGRFTPKEVTAIPNREDKFKGCMSWYACANSILCQLPIIEIPKALHSMLDLLLV